MSLIETFNRMQAEEAEVTQEKVAQQQETEETTERVELISKYASWAEGALEKEYGEGNYSAEDVEKVATAKMEEDAYEIYQREKVAEAYEMGAVMYEGFKAAAEADSDLEE